MRLLLSFVLIVAALVSALLLHAELTGGGDLAVKAAESQDRMRDRLSLELGEAPILVLESEKQTPAPKPPAPDPGPEPRPDPRPSPTRPPQRFVFLEPGGTISEVAQKQLGTMKRTNEILELNGWTEEDARRLHPGTKILLPPK